MKKLNKAAYTRILHNNKTDKTKVFRQILIYENEAYITDGFRLVKSALSNLTCDDDFATYESLDANGKSRVQSLAKLMHDRLTDFADDTEKFTTYQVNKAKYKKFLTAKKRERTNRYSRIVLHIGDAYMNAEHVLDLLEIIGEKEVFICVGKPLKPIVLCDTEYNKNDISAILCPMRYEDCNTNAIVFTLEDVENYDPKAEVVETPEEPVVEVTPDTKLGDVKSKAETRRLIMFGRDGNKAVIHKKKVRKISDTLYVGEPESDGWNKMCDIYVIFDEYETGMWIYKEYADRTVKETVERTTSDINSLPCLRAWYEDMIANNKWLHLVHVEFIKVAFPDLEAGAWEARKNYRQAQEDKRAERKAEAERKRKTEFEDGVRLSEEEIAEAIETIKNGGKLRNKYITIYKKTSDDGEFDYKANEYSIFNYLFRKYDITIPLKVQGFVNDKLHEVDFNHNGGVGYTYYRRGKSKGSTTLNDYLFKLKEAVIAV